MQTRTYADILDRIEALAGKDSFESAEQTRILSLVNARWYRAFIANEYWPRYITVGEARYVNQTTGAVPFTQASAVLVSGAGTDDANGIYQPVDTLNSRTRYFKNGDTSGHSIAYDGSTHWEIKNDGGVVLYRDGNGANPWSHTFTAINGAAPAPTVTESTRADIDGFMRLTTGAPYGNIGNDSGYEVDFYVTNNGAQPIASPTTGFTQLYVTYKQKWGGPYAANTTAVPIEFFEYIAHGAFADWLRSSGQSVPQAQAEDAIAQEMLNYELIRSQSRQNAQVNNNRFSTYISNQSRNFIA